MTDEEKFKNCYKCGTKTENAPGIGLFCPNKECDVSDNLENVQWTFVKQPTEYEKGFEAGKKAALSWQPIESAPKDGTEIFILCKGDSFPTVVFRLDDKWQAVESGLWLQPDWWLPLSSLPPAPEVSGEEQLNSNSLEFKGNKKENVNDIDVVESKVTSPSDLQWFNPKRESQIAIDRVVEALRSVCKSANINRLSNLNVLDALVHKLEEKYENI